MKNYMLLLIMEWKSSSNYIHDPFHTAYFRQGKIRFILLINTCSVYVLRYLCICNAIFCLLIIFLQFETCDKTKNVLKKLFTLIFTWEAQGQKLTEDLNYAWQFSKQEKEIGRHGKTCLRILILKEIVKTPHTLTKSCVHTHAHTNK